MRRLAAFSIAGNATHRHMLLLQLGQQDAAASGLCEEVQTCRGSDSAMSHTR